MDTHLHHDIKHDHKHNHVEEHLTSSETLTDIVIGMSDGLTVPFALAAGLSGAVSDVHLIVVAGIAEIAAGLLRWGWAVFLPVKQSKNTTLLN